MEPPTTKRLTLYDDWRARRRRLAGLPCRPGDYRAVELRLLDYLLRRYRDSPEATREARFSLTKDVYVDHRAIVVVHHLGGGHIPTVKSEREAHAHVQSIVRRMLSVAAREDVLGPDHEMGGRDMPLPERRAELLRMQLCDNDPALRVLAAVELGWVGTLDDIGLLSDLLSLPGSADEYPKERAALIHSMQRLAGVATGPFDLSGVLPAPGAEVPEEQSRSKRPAPAAGLTEEPSHAEPGDWKCSRCGADVPASFEICWACGTSIEGVEAPSFQRLDEP